jgi:hypothetical protein
MANLGTIGADGGYNGKPLVNCTTGPINAGVPIGTNITSLGTGGPVSGGGGGSVPVPVNTTHSSASAG